MPVFPSWRSPDVTTTTTEAADIQLQLTTHLSTQKYERLSWPSWLTYSGWLTHIIGHPSATTRAQDSESTSAKDQCSTAGPRNQQGEGRACPLPTVRNLAPALHVSTTCGVSRMPCSMHTAMMMKHHCVEFTGFLSPLFLTKIVLITFNIRTKSHQPSTENQPSDLHDLYFSRASGLGN